MEIKINKDIQEYKESIAFGLDMRQFFCSILAIVAGGGVYLLLNKVNGFLATIVAMVVVVPFGFLGFFKYNHLNAETLIFTVLKSRFLYSQKRVFCTVEMQQQIEKEQLQKKKKNVPKKKKSSKKKAEKD